MEDYLAIVIPIITLLIGYILGHRENVESREFSDKVYKDSQVLINQFANLSTQLFNQSRSSEGSSAFPPPELFKDPEPSEEPEPEPDLSGGRI